MTNPYYQDEAVTIYHGDCREILPLLPENSIDLILTDPPYDSQHPEYGTFEPSLLLPFHCRQLIFWSARDDFPLDYTAIHIWDKYCGTISVYERIFERNGQTNYKVYRGQKIQNAMTAQMSRDIITGHPSQKPRKVINPLISENSKVGGTVLDMYLGTGVVVEQAKKLNRKCIGIEIEERYCEIAASRCSQGVMDLTQCLK